MRDRDAEDGRLLRAGRHAELLAAYYPAIRGRLRTRLPGDDADEVAHRVIDRLIRELARGRTYSVPFRVVVHNVVGWKLREHFKERRHEPLPEEPELPDAGAADPDGRARARCSSCDISTAWRSSSRRAARHDPQRGRPGALSRAPVIEGAAQCPTLTACWTTSPRGSPAASSPIH